MHYVYLLKHPVSTAIYVGFTSELKRRFKEHQGSTRHRGSDLVYYEAYRNESDARERERKLKNYGSSLGKLKARIRRSMEISGLERAGSQ
jgi:predicted GIY-YIG superfamily endonuclease